MIEIVKKSMCCGCDACANICPLKCIEMKSDNEGFWYPEIDKGRCIGCNLCERVCPTTNKLDKNLFDKKAYACRNKNNDVRLNSSSGGIFTNLCEYVIRNNGVVFGAAFDANFDVYHLAADTINECIKFRGSKYVQSRIGNTYLEAKQYLESGKMVLFSGTQCQIKGLNLFLNKKYDNLITIDIVCHGVPSPLIFNMYKENLKNKYNSEIEYINFRGKNVGWKQFSYITKFKNKKQFCKIFSENLYMKGFLKNLYLRPSCYDCKSKNFSNNSDISLADYWGIENKHPEMDDDKGTSLIIVNTLKGKEVLLKISNEIEFLNSDLDYGISQNPCIVKPVEYNEKRKKFFEELENTNSENLESIINKYTTINFNEKLKRKIKKLLYILKKN